MPPTFRFALAAAILAIGAWFTWSQALDRTVAEVNPQLALRLGAASAETRGAAARALLNQTAEEGVRERAERLAREALRKDPTVLSAWSALGLLRAGADDLDGANAIFSALGRYAQRDLPTQLWLIDQRVRQGNIEGALRHYDIALRTKKSSDEVLLPVLVDATREPAVNARLAPLLAERPNWERSFLVRLAGSSPDNARLAQLLEDVYREDTAGMDDALVNIARRMAAEDAAGPAWRVFRLVAEREASEPVRNAAFERNNRWPPFDWELPDEGAVTALIANHPSDRGRVLDVRLASDARGEAARQLLSLPPGPYQLFGEAGAYDDVLVARIDARLVCTGPGGSVLAQGAVPTGGLRTIGTFTVPQDCPSQLLLLEASGPAGAGSSAAWVDRIDIKPGAGRGRGEGIAAK